jgi:hypothetical protein
MEVKNSISGALEGEWVRELGHLHANHHPLKP